MESLKVHANCLNKDETRFTEDEGKANVSEDEIYVKPEGDTGSVRIKQTVELRTRINQRERRRMHDLNVAMDALREVMPYGNGPSVRRLSKIATLSLARNYIQMLTKSVEELKHLLDEAYRARGVQGHYQRAAPLVYPDTWNFTSRGPRGFVPFNGYPSSALHSGCLDTTCTNEGSYSCCSTIAGSSLSIRGSHPGLHALQRQ